MKSLDTVKPREGEGVEEAKRHICQIALLKLGWSALYVQWEVSVTMRDFKL